MNILIDMDGIIVDLLGRWIEVQNRENGSGISVADVTAFDSAVLDNSIYNRDGFFDDLDPIPGAIEGVTFLANHGHNITIATSGASNADSARAKIEWVRRHFSHLSWGKNQMMIGSRKHLLSGDVLIDDSPPNVKDWLWFNAGQAITLKYPYTVEMDRLKVCDSWDQIVGHVAYLDGLSRASR